MIKTACGTNEGKSFRFKRAIVRRPAASIIKGLRALRGPDPDPNRFASQHDAYIGALKAAGLSVTILPALEDFPDSVFVEDAGLCIADTAIVLRPAAPTRKGEAAAIRPALKSAFETVIDLPGPGFVDGGDILVTDTQVMIGLSARTDARGIKTLSSILNDLGMPARLVETPPQILHFKTDCGLLDGSTILSTPRLAATGCFEAYRIIETAPGEDAAANAIRVNDKVFLSANHPRTADRLCSAGYDIVVLDTSEAALVDGGLSCMSLRF